METLTNAQYNALAYIRHFQSVNKMPPTRSELSKGLGYKSDNSAQELLLRLARKGYITLIDSKSRGIIINE